MSADAAREALIFLDRYRGYFEHEAACSIGLGRGHSCDCIRLKMLAKLAAALDALRGTCEECGHVVEVPKRLTYCPACGVGPIEWAPRAGATTPGGAV